MHFSEKTMYSSNSSLGPFELSNGKEKIVYLCKTQPLKHLSKYAASSLKRRAQTRDVFEPRAPTGTERFSYVICLLTTTFISSSVFSLVEMISGRPLSWHGNFFFSFDSLTFIRDTIYIIHYISYLHYHHNTKLNLKRRILRRQIIVLSVNLFFCLVFDLKLRTESFNTRK